MIVALLAVAAGLFPQDGTSERISLETYRARLVEARDALERGDVAEASRIAEWLLPREVAHDDVVFLPDPTVLRALADASDPDALTKARERLGALTEALGAVDPAKAAPAADRALLEKLRSEEAPLQIRRGGELGKVPPPPKSLVERIEAILEWIGEKIEAFLKWLFKLLGGRRAEGTDFSGLQALVWVLIITGITVLAVFAFMALRGRDGAPKGTVAASSAPVHSSRDEDPLSRSASGWEAHAAELMKAGRYREAIRAWYHALLVTMFRAGFLHYRKDRTNWEYAYSLSPDFPWRPRFMDATRSFEQEWYGRRETPADTADTFQGDATALLRTVRAGGER